MELDEDGPHKRYRSHFTRTPLVETEHRGRERRGAISTDVGEAV